jgi:hypothetical protein
MNMTVSTELQISMGSPMGLDPIGKRQGVITAPKPVVQYVSPTTGDWSLRRAESTELLPTGAPRRTFVPPTNVSTMPEVKPDSTPLQVWEGTVVSVDNAAGIMQVVLDAKIGQMPRHTAEIELSDVSSQDEDLVRPGAVFYLTLYKRTLPSVENVEELRFRRRPSWSSTQLARIDKEATKFLSKMKAPPTAA